MGTMVKVLTMVKLTVDNPRLRVNPKKVVHCNSHEQSNVLQLTIVLALLGVWHNLAHRLLLKHLINLSP